MPSINCGDVLRSRYLANDFTHATCGSSFPTQEGQLNPSTMEKRNVKIIDVEETMTPSLHSQLQENSYPVTGLGKRIEMHPAEPHNFRMAIVSLYPGWGYRYPLTNHCKRIRDEI